GSAWKKCLPHLPPPGYSHLACLVSAETLAQPGDIPAESAPENATMNDNDPDLDRRDLLGTMSAVGALAAGALLAEEVAGAGPAGAVEDKTSTLKITALKGFVVGPKAYLRLDTNHKITGWGEVTGLDPRVSVALAESLFELLDGENPTRVEHLWQ